MPSLKEVRNRIASVKSTQQITSAMKMVAASKLRKAQTGILQLRPFANRQKELLQKLGSDVGGNMPSELSDQRVANHVLIVALSSNRGLCGAFNTNVIKQSISVCNSYMATGSKVSYVTIGRKASEFFQKNGYDVIKSHDEIYDNINFAQVSALADHLIDLFMSHKFDKVILIYHQFKNAVVQYLVAEQFLPISPIQNQDGNEQKADYIFDPSREEILETLVPSILRTQVYKAVLDSWASEQGARMTAMSQATDNASELLKELKLTYNKARQAAITNEILEIVSGAEALKK